MASSSPPDINHRARRILAAVVSEYLSTGDAVGSRTVTRKHSIPLSPATVRNVMADLEELGLLAQPHTSAGRVPTRSGLRFFIDSLLKVRGLSKREKSDIRVRLAADSHDLDEVVQRASRVLSEITHHTAIVLAPNPEKQRVKHVEFVPLQDNKYLCILVTTDGHIENRLFHADFRVDRARLERVHNYLSGLLAGLTLDEMRQRVLEELGEQKNRYDELVSSALRLSKAALDQPASAAAVVVSGQANLLDAARADGDEGMARMRDMLQALEDKEVVIRLLDESLAGTGIQVFLGAEIAHAALGSASLVVTPYGRDEQPLGAIAVVGPMRMNYGKVMSIVDFTADVVTGLIDEL